MLWDKPTIAADRPMYPSGQYTFVTYADLHAFLVGHRQDFSTGLPSLSGATDSSLAMAVLGQWQWYRGLTTDIYAQITTNFLANTDLPIWPNFLDTDYAVMYHRMLNHKRILGALLLHQGASLINQINTECVRKIISCLNCHCNGKKLRRKLDRNKILPQPNNGEKRVDQILS